MSSTAFTTRVKLRLNALLKPLGLEMQTTLRQRRESARIRKLQDRGHWTVARYTEGLTLNVQSYLNFLSNTCDPYKTDFRAFPQNANGNPTEFYRDNSWFGSVDAELLYSFVRYHKPRRVVEVGSGFSTRLIRKAVKDGNLSTQVTSVDPHPNTEVRPYADAYIKRPIEDVALSEIVDTLESGDLLFVDSSHSVVTGGDVPYLFLEVLPRLKPGVFIHVHDIFLPFDYPEQWVLEGYGWSEQYLVHAFLCYNVAFEIIWPARYMWEYHQSRIRELIPAKQDIFPPSSLWLQKIA